ncbi:MAG: hypothetical protein PVG03_09655 [Desulfarculaceae bacterium]|jgi:hypothetical protein
MFNHRYLNWHLLALALQALAWFFYLDHTRNLAFGLDTRDYLGYGFNSLALMFSNTRTFAYPLFLKMVSWLFGGYRLLPLIQYVIFFLATILFWLAMLSFGIARMPALIIASSLLYTDLLRRYCWQIHPDTLAGSLVLMSLAGLLLILSQPQKKKVWVFTGCAVFLAYQVRPVYLFLLVLLPLLSLVLFKTRPKPVQANAILPLAGKIAALAFIPFLLFGLFRYRLTGQFGLVSLQGANLLGITAYSLDQDLVNRLPKKDRELAGALLIREADRQKAKQTGKAAYGDTWFWRNIAPEKWHERAILYDVLVHDRAYPALGFEKSEDKINRSILSANSRMLSLAWGILKERPGDYIEWVGGDLVVAIWQMLRADPLIKWLSYALGLILLLKLLLGLMGVNLTLWKWPGAFTDFKAGLICLTLVGLSLFAVGTMIICMVQIPKWRFLSPLTLFHPGIIILAMATALLRPGSGRKSHT